LKILEIGWIVTNTFHHTHPKNSERQNRGNAVTQSFKVLLRGVERDSQLHDKGEERSSTLTCAVGYAQSGPAAFLFWMVS
jgi:hypothetical protein